MRDQCDQEINDYTPSQKIVPHLKKKSFAAVPMVQMLNETQNTKEDQLLE